MGAPRPMVAKGSGQQKAPVSRAVRPLNLDESLKDGAGGLSDEAM